MATPPANAISGRRLRPSLKVLRTRSPTLPVGRAFGNRGVRTLVLLAVTTSSYPFPFSPRQQVPSRPRAPKVPRSMVVEVPVLLLPGNSFGWVTLSVLRVLSLPLVTRVVEKTGHPMTLKKLLCRLVGRASLRPVAPAPSRLQVQRQCLSLPLNLFERNLALLHGTVTKVGRWTSAR